MTAERLGDEGSPQRQSLRSALRVAARELDQHRPPAQLSARALASLKPAVTAELDGRRRSGLALAAAGSHATRVAATPGIGPLTPREPAAGAWRLWFRPWAWPKAASLALVLLLSLGVTLLLPPPLGDPPVAELALPSGFVPLTGAEGLPLGGALPGEAAMTAWLVATEMPRERLGSLGLPFDPSRAGENVRAELLMHGSGAVLAVRVVAQ